MAMRSLGVKQSWAMIKAEARPTPLTKSQSGGVVRTTAPPKSPGAVLLQGVSQYHEVTTSSLPPRCSLMGSEVMGWTKYLPYPSHLDSTPGLSQKEPQHQQKARSLAFSHESCEAHAIGLREWAMGSCPVPGSALGIIRVQVGRVVFTLEEKERHTNTARCHPDMCLTNLTSMSPPGVPFLLHPPLPLPGLWRVKKSWV